jgi:hypothetical protein
MLHGLVGEPWGQFFKTRVGPNSHVGANSAKCHRCVGASSPRRRERSFKKLATGTFCFWFIFSSLFLCAAAAKKSVKLLDCSKNYPKLFDAVCNVGTYVPRYICTYCRDQNIPFFPLQNLRLHVITFLLTSDFFISLSYHYIHKHLESYSPFYNHPSSKFLYIRIHTHGRSNSIENYICMYICTKMYICTYVQKCTYVHTYLSTSVSYFAGARIVRFYTKLKETEDGFLFRP